MLLTLFLVSMFGSVFAAPEYNIDKMKDPSEVRDTVKGEANNVLDDLIWFGAWILTAAVVVTSIMMAKATDEGKRAAIKKYLPWLAAGAVLFWAILAFIS